LTNPKPDLPPSGLADASPAEEAKALTQSYIERAANEMATRRGRRAGAGAPLPGAASARQSRSPDGTLTLETVRLRRVTSVTRAESPLPPDARASFRAIHDDHLRLSLTRWQATALTVAIAALVIGALGMAASGWVAAYHWSCRTGFASAICSAPTLPVQERPMLPELPT
jgi:hypothetical protein